jgi:hypothetical protein
MTELRTVRMELGRTADGPVVLGRNNCVRLMLNGTRVRRTWSARVRGWLMAALAAAVLAVPMSTQADASAAPVLRHGEFGMEAGTVGLLAGHPCRRPPCPAW